MSESRTELISCELNTDHQIEQLIVLLFSVAVKSCDQLRATPRFVSAYLLPRKRVSASRCNGNLVFTYSLPINVRLALAPLFRFSGVISQYVLIYLTFPMLWAYGIITSLCPFPNNCRKNFRETNMNNMNNSLPSILILSRGNVEF
jgi:hypothetical protein